MDFDLHDMTLSGNKYKDRLGIHISMKAIPIFVDGVVGTVGSHAANKKENG